MLGHKRIPSREGGIEIVVEELATRMVTLGHKVTCYNRSGHHVSGKDFDGGKRKAYKGVRLKSVLTLDKKGLAAMTASVSGAICAAFGKYDVVHFHPVFFLSKNEWLERIPNKREINEPYIFAYFLGATQEYRNAVKKLSRDKGMKVVALRHMDQYVEEDENFGDFAPYDVSPERFLNLLRNAEYVCTDSFHGTACSVFLRVHLQ